MTKLVGDRYQLLSKLGQGGMATVWRARDERLRRDVAVKLLDVKDDEDLFYFHREARAAAALSHRNIVPIHDYSGMGEIPPWIVMELIVGDTVDELGNKRGALPAWVVAVIGNGVASALAHAHAQGVIHRDIKPENVLVALDGRVLLTDFGIAKAYADENKLGQTSIAEITRLSGTPAFMSPEQIAGETVGPPCDVFSLGATLYAAITGASPFAATDMLEVAKKVAKVSYTPLGEDVDPALRELVHQCLARQPETRPSAQAVAQSLLKLLARAQVMQPEVSLAAFAQGAQGDGQTVIATAKVGTKAPENTTSPRVQTPRRWMAAVWTAAAAIMSAIVWYALRPDPPPPPPQPSTRPVVAHEPPPETPKIPVPAPWETPKVPPPVRVDPPEDRKPDPKPKKDGPGTLEIIVIPWGKVVLDGETRGVTPVVRELSVAPGKHTVSIEHPTFGKRKKVVEVRVGHRTTVEVDFTAE